MEAKMFMGSSDDMIMDGGGMKMGYSDGMSAFGFNNGGMSTGVGYASGGLAPASEYTISSGAMIGVLGNKNENVFYGSSDSGKVEATQQIFPNGNTGVVDGDWVWVDSPINMGIFGMVANKTLQFVPFKKQVSPNIKVAKPAVNIFEKTCPSGFTDLGLFCKEPDSWSACNPGEMDSGAMCMNGFNMRPKMFNVGKMISKNDM